MTDLIHTEHAYAPPYSSAKDPVAMAGYVAENIISGKMKPIYWRELSEKTAEETQLIDVRTEIEYASGALPGAVNIPLDSLRERLGEISRERETVVYCGVGLRGYLASNILRQNGFDNVRNLIGGIKTYRTAMAQLPQPEPFENGISEMKKQTEDKDVLRIDACGLYCPGPIMKLKEAIDGASDGQTIEIMATDPGFVRDAQAWCDSTGNEFISSQSSAGKYSISVTKGTAKNAPAVTGGQRDKTFVLFSDDLDKALATFVLANGAAATGEKVTIFFTFWGLNVIKKTKKPKVRKDIFGKMFSMMLPSDSGALKLSKMNMMGAGAKMMRHIMKHRNLDSLEQLREAAVNNGVEFIACQMSMDVMGVTREELLDNVTIGGVATYMNRTDTANLNLFI